MFDTRKIIEVDAKTALLNFLNENLLIALPLEITQGFNEQIRIRKSDYDILSDDIKKLLSDCADFAIDENNVYAKDSEAKQLYETTHYWKNCDAYIFNYTLRKSFKLLSGCKYGFDGREDYEKEIWFLYKDEFPLIILENLGCHENVEPRFGLGNK